MSILDMQRIRDECDEKIKQINDARYKLTRENQQQAEQINQLEARNKELEQQLKDSQEELKYNQEENALVIKELKEQSGQWVSVDTRLPEEASPSQQVLVAYEYKDVVKNFGITHFYEGKFFDYICKGYKVTHWKPINPPEVNSNG